MLLVEAFYIFNFQFLIQPASRSTFVIQHSTQSCYRFMALLTLTSDIGQQDYLVGAIKGQLLQINRDFTLVDVSHTLAPFNFSQAAYICKNAIRNFPPYTYHLLIVNLFEKKPEQLLLVYHKEQYILCADNGLI